MLVQQYAIEVSMLMTKWAQNVRRRIMIIKSIEGCPFV